MNLSGKAGFIIKGKFFSNNGLGHETNARNIIHHMNWTNEWTKGDAQDFLVLKKGAVQIGSGLYWKKIVVARVFFNESKIERIKKKYHLDDYECDFIKH